MQFMNESNDPKRGLLFFINPKTSAIDEMEKHEQES